MMELNASNTGSPLSPFFQVDVEEEEFQEDFDYSQIIFVPVSF